MPPKIKSRAYQPAGASRQQKFRQRPRAEIAFALVAHRNRARFGFLAADDQHVGNLLHLRVANFRLQFFVAVVEMRAETGGAQLGGDVTSHTRRIFR